MIISLIELAEKMRDYTLQMEFGGAAQRKLANTIITEINQILKHHNEMHICTLLQVSIIPKMNQLAQDLQLHQKIITKQWLNIMPRNKITHVNLPFYETFRPITSTNKSYSELETDEQQSIDEKIQEIYTIFDMKESQ